jgi:hypothetical protein
MISSLHDPVVSRVLDALHSEADTVDPPLLANMGDKTDDEMANLLDQAFIPVSPEAGRILTFRIGDDTGVGRLSPPGGLT